MLQIFDYKLNLKNLILSLGIWNRVCTTKWLVATQKLVSASLDQN